MTNKNHKKFIVKIQRPIISNHEEDIVLVYNKNKSIMQELPAPKHIKKFMNNEFKQYAWAWINKDKKIVLDKLAEWQEW